MVVGGSALDRACVKIIAKGKRIAAHLLEAAEGDVAFGDGRFPVAGTDRGVSFAEVARAANLAHALPPDIEPGLHETAFYDPSNFAYSNGAHVCEIEGDPDTGTVRIVRYVAVDDVGTVINPMIVEGQVHGGLAQGLGQALMERMAYEPSSAQLQSGSFMDYAMPRAGDLPDFRTETDESQPCTHNPLGAKGCGESGAIGAPAALVSTVLDATGAEDVEMSCAPERVWRALARGDASGSPDRARASMMRGRRVRLHCVWLDVRRRRLPSVNVTGRCLAAATSQRSGLRSRPGHGPIVIGR
jgi:carbon-monoxide dehydrogenase large subunit